MKWIDVKERKPNQGKVIVYFPIASTSPMDAIWDGNHFIVDGVIRTKLVTHWMPLPDPPNFD